MSQHAVASLTKTPPRSEAEIAARLDQFHADMHGPYIVNGQTYPVPAHFRSNGDAGKSRVSGDLAQKRIREFLGPEKSRELAHAIQAATTSLGTPSDIRSVVQALIDKGALEKFPGTPPELAIRKMMWELGIGLDCRRYVAHAFAYARGTGAKPASLQRYGLDLAYFDFKKACREVGIGNARAGDIIRLKPLEGRDHNVIVRSNRLENVEGRGLVVSGRRIPAAFAEDGWPPGQTPRVRILEVDSSWGGGDYGDFGGAERKVWIQNEKTGVWGYWDPDGEFRVSEGPYGHSLDGVYRPTGER